MSVRVEVREAVRPHLALALPVALLPRVELAPPSLPLGHGHTPRRPVRGGRRARAARGAAAAVRRGRPLARRGGGPAERLALSHGGRGEQRAWGGRAARRREAAVGVALEVLRGGGGEARRHAVDARAEGAVLLPAR